MKGAVPSLLRILLLLLPAGGLLQAADRPVASRVEVDWPRRQVVIDASLSLDSRLSNVSKARHLAEAQIEERLPGILMEFLLALPLDSFHTVGEALGLEGGARPAGPDPFRGRILASALSPDLREVRLRSEVPLYGEGGIIGPFVTHTRPSPIPRFLGFAPSPVFTGLVVYACGLYPVHGHDEPQRVRPALLPRLFDPLVRPVLEPRMCDPDALRKWGMAAYTAIYTDNVEKSEEPFRDRVGEFPLRTMARGIYGRYATDLILSDDAVRALLGREENRDLLRQGRILIVIDPSS